MGTGTNPIAFQAASLSAPSAPAWARSPSPEARLWSRFRMIGCGREISSLEERCLTSATFPQAEEPSRTTSAQYLFRLPYPASRPRVGQVAITGSTAVVTFSNDWVWTRDFILGGKMFNLGYLSSKDEI